jgi:membrane protein DedA with SNARE-associated domain
VPVWIVDLFARYGYWAVFVGVFLENAGLPVPGETALLAGAALTRSGPLSAYVVITTAIAGAIRGDNVGFGSGAAAAGLVGRFGGKVGWRRRASRVRSLLRSPRREGRVIARFVTGCEYSAPCAPERALMT